MDRLTAIACFAYGVRSSMREENHESQLTMKFSRILGTLAAFCAQEVHTSIRFESLPKRASLPAHIRMVSDSGGRLSHCAQPRQNPSCIPKQEVHLGPGRFH